MAELTTLLRVADVRRTFHVGGGLLRRPERIVRAVDGVSLDVNQGETLSIVGESGSGKTTLARIIVGLLVPSSGSLVFDGRPMTWSGKAGQQLRRQVQMIFQDPSGSLDPRWRVRDLVREPLDVFDIGTKREREAAVSATLDRVGLDDTQATKRPSQLSGGQRQRVGIARAVTLRPRLVICDEPVSALDVSIRGQILDLLSELRRDFGLTFIFISHDISVVQRMADRVLTMYLGQVVEVAEAGAFFGQPLHPYAQALLSAVPAADPDVQARQERIVIAGEVPDASRIPAGCRFHPRCPLAQTICREEEPELREITPGRWARCHFAPDATLRPSDPESASSAVERRP